MCNQTRGQAHFWIALILGLSCAAPTLAADPACQAPWAAMARLRNKPFHMYTTSDNKFGSPTFDKAAASIGVAGVKKSEEIWTGKDVYVLNKGRWIDMHTNFAEMNNGREDDPDAKKAHEAERCETLPDETVFGQSAAVYQIHDPVLGNDTKIWVSKSNHLPIKSESTTHTDQATFFASSRYDYDNVQAPANSISMPDMLRRK